jgi:hypothetical protein
MPLRLYTDTHVAFAQWVSMLVLLIMLRVMDGASAAWTK